MGGFIPAEAGTIRVYGNAVNGPGPDRGMMFQEFALFPVEDGGRQRRLGPGSAGL